MESNGSHLTERNDKQIKPGKKEALKKVFGGIQKGTRDYLEAPLPPSLTWLYGLGFKVGIILAFKAYLFLKARDLTNQGKMVIFTELIISILLITFGCLIQDDRVRSRSAFLWTSIIGYFFSWIISLVVSHKQVMGPWKFIEGTGSSNIILNLFSKAQSGTRDLIIKLLFSDIDLVGFCCFLLGFILLIYTLTTKVLKSKE